MSGDLLDLDTPEPTQEKRGPSPATLALREAHAQHPDAKLVHITDEREGITHGGTVVLVVSPASPWHDLLPPWQLARIVSTKAAA